MTTFEVLQRPSPREHFAVPDTYALMGETTVRLIADLEEIHEAVGGDEHGLTFAVFGSPARYEMLPQSDVDVLLVSEYGQENTAYADARQALAELPYDKVDLPHTQMITDGEFRSYAASNSPDSHTARALVVASATHALVPTEIREARKVLDRVDLQVEGLVFDYHFLNDRAARKAQDDGANLKYSPGGTRDIVYFDWFADYLTGGGAGHRSQATATPNILTSMSVIHEVLDGRVSIEGLSCDVNFVNALKYLALKQRDEGAQFDGMMSRSTAEQLAVVDELQDNQFSAEELIEQHRQARSTISFAKDALHTVLVDILRDDATHQEEASHLLLIDRVWDQDPTIEREKALATLIERGRWVDLGTVVSQPDATSEQIDQIVDVALRDEAYLHAIRIAIQHPNTESSTLLKMLDAKHLATDDDIDMRYRAMLLKRVEDTYAGL